MTNPGGHRVTKQSFANDEEYLTSLYVLMDLLLFFDPDSRMERWGLPEGQNTSVWRQVIEAGIRSAKEAGTVLSLECAMERAGLPSEMRLCLAYLLRMTLDPDYERDASLEWGKERLTLLDLVRIFGAYAPELDAFSALEAAREGLELLFPQLAGRDMIASLTPVMDRRLIAMLTGKNSDRRLPCGMRVLQAPSGESGIETEQKLVDIRMKLAGELFDRENRMPPEVVVLWGPEGAGKKSVIRVLADLLERSAVLLPLHADEEGRAGSMDSSSEGRQGYPIYPDAALLLRECVLTGSLPVISGLEKLSKVQARQLMELLRTRMLPLLHTVYVLANTEEEPDDLGDAFYLEIPSIRTADRIALWKRSLCAGAAVKRAADSSAAKSVQQNDLRSKDDWKDNDRGEDSQAESARVDAAAGMTTGNTTGLPDEAVIEALANTFDLTPGQILACADQAIRMAGPGRPVSEDHLYRACYALLGHPLKNHSQRVQTIFTWDDLKMEPQDKAVLSDLCQSVRSRHIVMQEWGFEAKVPYGAGITALFSGPPGTGKTMAAQVIANELHMELYKIDVSQLIDKYVGETEKNIRRVFDQAKKSHAVLFFDEADAIFNKRLEAKNSNERFANIESSLLLQCIEEYSGVALLATNNMAAIDAAFIRRFKFYLTFKEPKESIRREIWHAVFPKGTPLDPEVNFDELAHIFNFNGSIIKNVALQAAYLAAARKKPVGLLEIMVAIRRELEKNQRVLAREKMGSLAYLFEETMAWS